MQIARMTTVIDSTFKWNTLTLLSQD